MKPSVAVTAMALALGACHHDGGDAVLLIVVTASGSPGTVASLDVTLSGPAGSSGPVRYTRDDQQPIVFPTTLTAVVPARATGALTIDVHATDATGAIVATGREGPVTVHSGDHETVYVQVDCGGSPCVTDGGGTGTDGGPPGGGPSCGNGRVDPNETCDTAIARQDPGACPPADPLHPCDDGVACTRDIATGSGCTASCAHEEITAAAAGDDCCPAGATSADDPDCSPTCGNGTVDPKETCDIAIAPGSPGACPTDCKSGDPCADELLVSAGTCSAICMHYPVTKRDPKISDGCCPPGATNGADTDCPVVCGNGVWESSAGEACDVGIPPLLPGSCPTGCPRKDDDPCDNAILTDKGCQTSCVHIPISAPLSGDGCCPKGATHATDTDCPPSCGNGVLEPGEACDKTAAGINACPTACPTSPSACLKVVLVGSADDCTAHCVTMTVTACSDQKDSCCPAGCTSATDADCAPRCGDGFIERTFGEVCDVGIPPPRPGSCPTSCTSPNPCSEARLISAGTCAATCVLIPITEARAGDGCCPAGADFSVDTDCIPSCGNGVVESPFESCDYNAGGGASCPTQPTQCPAADACTLVELRGSPLDCSATCTAEPIVACGATVIRSGKVEPDRCCPAGCTAVNDSDCPAICGDGAVEQGERCDRAITAGMPGACLRSCDDGNDCTVDVAYGSVEGCTRSCSHQPVTACLGGDGCCPTGCTAATDSDCAPVCGDGKIGAGETCDPPATCPTTCADDGDPCTAEHLTGDPAHCNAVCRHTPITTCSGTTGDACCPTGCTSATDSDC